MDEYIRAMQIRLRAKKIGYKKEFLREILKEVRVRGNDVRTPRSDAKQPRKEEFFTLYHLVEAASQCKEPLLQISFSLN
jgi:hypothetical protein